MILLVDRVKQLYHGNTVYCSIDNFRNYANATHFFCFEHANNSTVASDILNTNSYVQYVKVNTYLNIRDSVYGNIIGKLYDNDKVTVYQTDGNWSRIGDNEWVCSDYLSNTVVTPSTQYVRVNTCLNIRDSANGNIVGKLYNNDPVTIYETNGNWSRIGYNQWICNTYLISNINMSNNSPYTTGNYKVTASLLNVRTGPGTNYSIKNYNQLSVNARSQNKELGNSFANGYLRGIICTVTQVYKEWGLTNSGWISLDFCKKI